MQHQIKKEIQSELRGIKTQFDSLEKRIRQKLIGVQGHNLEGMHKELDVLQAAVQDMAARIFLDFPIIENIPIEDISGIFGMKGKEKGTEEESGE